MSCTSSWDPANQVCFPTDGVFLVETADLGSFKTSYPAIGFYGLACHHDLLCEFMLWVRSIVYFLMITGCAPDIPRRQGGHDEWALLDWFCLLQKRANKTITGKHEPHVSNHFDLPRFEIKALEDEKKHALTKTFGCFLKMTLWPDYRILIWKKARALSAAALTTKSEGFSAQLFFHACALGCCVTFPCAARIRLSRNPSEA